MYSLYLLQSDQELQHLLKMSDQQLDMMGYTDHGERHRQIVCRRITKILACSGADQHTIQLGIIAGYLHDIGCAVARHSHAQSGAIMVYSLLLARGIDVQDAVLVSNAIANHDEATGHASTSISASLILADKSDVHRNRVRTAKLDGQYRLKDVGDIHDRVNYSVIDSHLDIDEQDKKVIFRFALDNEVASISDYFEIFLGRMKMCRTSAEVLGLQFELTINGQVLT